MGWNINNARAIVSVMRETICLVSSLRTSSLGGGGAIEGKMERELAPTSQEFEFRSAPSAAVAPRCLSCQILANQRKPKNVTNMLNT